MNGRVKYWFLLAASMGFVSCANQDKSLMVKQFYLRDEVDKESVEPMIRAEKNRALYGAVSMEERKQRLGQYYTVLWNDPEGVGSAPAVVTFEFQQGGSGSVIKKRTQTFDASNDSGKAVFSVIGDDYFKSGKVLTWKITLSRGARVVSSKQSYLWE